MILSDIGPKPLTYRVVREIPHSTDDYTQGLVYYNGNLYESTGRPGHSRLMRKPSFLFLAKEIIQYLAGENTR